MQNIEGSKSATVIILLFVVVGVLFFGGIHFNCIHF